MKPRVLALAALAAALPLVGVPARAQSAPPVAETAPATSGVPLSLESAIATTLAHDPEIALAAERMAQQRAALEEARGLFDRKVVARTALDYSDKELSSGRFKSERDRRLRMELPPPVFDTISKSLISRLPVAPGDVQPGSVLFPDCSQATTFFVVRDSETDAIQSVLCFDSDDNLIGILGTPGGQEALNGLNLAGLFDDLSAVDERMAEFIRAQLALLADEMRVIAIALRQTAASLRLQRVRVGQIPEEQENIRFELGLDWQHRFKGGTAFLTTLDMVSTEDNYKGKRLSPAYGDSLIPNTFTTTFGLGLDVPLGRGGGRKSFGATLRAAEQNALAAEALWAHLASQRVLATLEAYWNAASAAKRLALLEESLATQERVLGATEQLVEADVVPRVDLSRNRARRAEVASQVAAARQALAVANLGLQRSIGLDASSMAVAPAAIDGFGDGLAADPLGEAAAEALVARAVELRRDVDASAALVAANQTLAEAAKHDLRPEVALTLKVSYNAFHETFVDRFYDFEGFSKALEDKYAGPTYGMTFRFRLPVGNRSAKGRLMQTEAAASQSRITAGDLERTISLTVRELAKTIVETRAELQSRRDALRYHEESHQASLERFREGDLTLIDALTTEEQLTQARLQLVDAERRYLSLVAQLRFETGLLIDLPPADVSSARLRPLAEPLL